MLFDIGVTLREGDREYFYKQLNKHFPGMKEQYIRTYGNAYEVPSLNNKKLMKMVKDECKHNGIVCDSTKLFSYMREFEDKSAGKQITLEEHFNV